MNFKDAKTGEKFYYPKYRSTYDNGKIVYIVNGKKRPNLISITPPPTTVEAPAIRTPTKNR
jgi:hypothetical protein